MFIYQRVSVHQLKLPEILAARTQVELSHPFLLHHVWDTFFLITFCHHVSGEKSMRDHPVTSMPEVPTRPMFSSLMRCARSTWSENHGRRQKGNNFWASNAIS
jgi:hypothetical protein